jgi:hypothetical protein
LYILGFILFLLFFFLLILTASTLSYTANLFLLILMAFILLAGCVVYEFSLIWKAREGLFQPIFSVFAAFSSFVSIFLARCVIVYYTGVEPELISTASIVFSIVFEIPVSILIATIISLLFYAIIICAGIFFVPFSFLLTIDLTTFKNTRFWKLWFRNNIKGSTQSNKRSRKTPIKFILYTCRVVGLALLGTAGLCCLIFTLNIALTNEITLNNAAKEIIIHANYRPKNKISECNNLQDDEWGLLLKNEKISVAKMQSFGGYSFVTKVCLFV